MRASVSVGVSVQAVNKRVIGARTREGEEEGKSVRLIQQRAEHVKTNGGEKNNVERSVKFQKIIILSQVKGKEGGEEERLIGSQ